MQLLRDSNIEPQIIDYIKNPPSIAELKRISRLLGLDPSKWIRKTEKDYKNNNLKDIKDSEKIFSLMSKYPKLIERPIVIYNEQAVIGRPPENVLALK